MNDTDHGRGENSSLRMVVLYCVLVLPMLAVGYRLVSVMKLKDVYAAEFQREIIDHEIIPARNGRIVAESVVLATDIEQYDISVHYRWLEHPPNADWLKERARENLERKLWRNKNAVRKAEQKFYHDHESTWLRLSKMISTPYPEIRQKRADVQTEVERIIESVNRRHQQRRDSKADESKSTRQPDGESPKWFQAIRNAVTTQPDRNNGSRIIVMEELDYHPVIRDVPLEVAAEIKAHPELFPGFRITTSTQRKYPQATLASHTVGSRTFVKAEELASRKERFPDGDPYLLTEKDRIGRTGVERTYDRRIRGINGLRKVVRNRHGRIVRTEIVREPGSGKDVHLTLDARLQSTAEELLDNVLNQPKSEGSLPVPAGASVVVLDVHTGAVLASASAPGYDLNLLVESKPDAWNQLLADSRRPMINRSIQMAIPPGSIFKTLSAVALVESGTVDPDAGFYCQGFLSRPDQHRCLIYRHYGLGHGDITLARALSQSCNVFFFDGAKRMGPTSLVGWAKKFGFGQPTGIDLPFEKSGNLPQPPTESNRRSSGDRWYAGDTMGLAIGQSRLLVTPTQIARMMAAVSNGGFLVTPHTVHEDGLMVVSQSESAQMTRRSRRQIPDLDQMTLARVREGLTMAVQHPQGTGYKTVRIPEVKIAGKTGTAEVGSKLPDHSWFAGYAPADRPEVAFCVVLEHGGSGSKGAGPIARQLIQSMLQSGTLQASLSDGSNARVSDSN